MPTPSAIWKQTSVGSSNAAYQIAVLGFGEIKHGAALRSKIMERVTDIGKGVASSVKFFNSQELPSCRATAPLVAVYLGGDSHTDEEVVARLLEQAVPILPVVADLAAYCTLVPRSLSTINGALLDWETPDFNSIVNVVLENLSLLRRTRRLFLSYLRKESTAVAHQLRVAFDDAGYDAFLDTSSVAKGDEFQSVLWHRLLDSDVAVVLDTPNFLSSYWTQQEIAQALAMSVGIVRVVWPGSGREKKAELALHVYLDEHDFHGKKLKVAAIRRITRETEALRARCIAARHSNLVVEFCEEADRIGALTVVQPSRYVLARLQNGRRIAAVPAVGVPDANRYHEANSRFPVAGEQADEVVLIYDHRGMLPAWSGFLNWLDEYLPVRGLRVTETAAKLGEWQ